MNARIVISIALALMLVPGLSADEPKKPFLLGFLAGDYRLIGQEPDSGAAYVGRVSLRPHDGKFEVTRTIGGVRTNAAATLEISAEGTAVLKCRFAAGGVDYEATYLWRSDLDNYPRLTGYVSRVQGPTKSPGLEALFHIPPTPEQ